MANGDGNSGWSIFLLILGILSIVIVGGMLLLIPVIAIQSEDDDEARARVTTVAKVETLPDESIVFTL